jgi:chemotaxis family two-component system response regulator Rcp1
MQRSRTIQVIFLTIEDHSERRSSEIPIGVEPTERDQRSDKGKGMIHNRADVSRPIELFLVEDNPGDIRLAKEMFKEAKLKLNLTVAEDGVKAIEYLKNVCSDPRMPMPELIILDLNLPKKDGREVLSEIKTNEKLKRIPVIVLTSSTSSEDVSKAYGEHANCYIAKPVDLDEFARIIKIIEEFWFKTVILPSRSRT